MVAISAHRHEISSALSRNSKNTLTGVQYFAIRLSLWLTLFPGLVLLIHQIVLHSWQGDIGFFGWWSLSQTVLFGDSILCVAVAINDLLRRNSVHKTKGQGGSLWAHGWRYSLVIAIVATSLAPLIALWIFDVNGRPPLNPTIHHFEWVYDGYHLTIASVVSSRLTVGLSFALHRLYSSHMERRETLIHLISLGLVATYFFIAFTAGPAIRFDTGIRYAPSWAQQLPEHLFSQRAEQIAESETGENN